MGGAAEACTGKAPYGWDRGDWRAAGVYGDRTGGVRLRGIEQAVFCRQLRAMAYVRLAVSGGR